jgi:quinol monooxygenase YgiN
MALTFIAHWFPLPEKRSEFTSALNELASSIPQSLYATANYIKVTWNRRGEFIACESWRDEDAINAFRATAVFHDAIRKMTACCSRPLELEILDELDGDESVFGRYPAGIADPRFYPCLGSMNARII